MSAPAPSIPPATTRLGSDFWKFWAGQTVSNLGSSVTLFALPLLVFELTGSAVNLGLTAAVTALPYLLFGLVLGAWVDRTDRRRLMIAADIARALLVASIPLLATLDRLAVPWIYAAGFAGSTLTICFDAAQFAAIPSLVPMRDLVTANGRLQASFSAATILGPMLAGFALAAGPIETLLLVDALSFLVSAGSLALIRRGFNAAVGDGEAKPPTSLGRDVMDGLRYVLGHPVLRLISAMMLLVNFVGITTYAQLVLFAKERLGAGDAEVGLLYAAEGAGVVVLSLLAGPLRRRWSFSVIALGALMASGLLTIALAATTSYPTAVALVAAMAGLGVLFNINTGSLRQAIVPNHLLGRVISVAMVLASAATPAGALLGGWAIERTGSVAVVFAAIGGLVFLIALGFGFTPLGRAGRYLPPEEGSRGVEAVTAR